jgi:hypothetical protein
MRKYPSLLLNVCVLVWNNFMFVISIKKNYLQRATLLTRYMDFYILVN